RRRHTRFSRDWSSDVCSSDLHGCFIGSAAVMVLSDKDDIRAAVQNLMRFFEDESCGQCTPCRAGTEKAAKLLQAERWDVPLLQRSEERREGKSVELGGRGADQ